MVDVESKKTEGAVGAAHINQPLSAGLGPYDKEMLRAVEKGKVPTRIGDLNTHETEMIFGGLRSSGHIGPDDKLTAKGKAALKESWRKRLVCDITEALVRDSLTEDDVNPL